MDTRRRIRSLTYVVVGLLSALSVRAHAAPEAARSGSPTRLATGQFVTPKAPRGAVSQALNPGLPAYPRFVAGEAVRSQLSPDGKTLAILCAGQNSLAKPDGTTDTDNSTQYIFLYDVSGRHKTSPRLRQVLKQTNAHLGLVFAPDGSTLYAAGGRDDSVYSYSIAHGAWSLSKTIPLGHEDKGVGIEVAPNASGLGITADGKTLVVANNYNDSITVIDTATAAVRYEHDLRPYFANNEGVAGGVGGTFPFGVTVKGNDVAYVSSDRNREVIAVDISSATEGRLIKRIALPGNPLGMTLDASGSRLFVAQDNADQVAVIDTATQTVTQNIDARGPASLWAGSTGASYTGAGTFSVTLSPDGKTLFAVNSGSNSIAVIALAGEGGYQATGLIPTAYEPHDITFSADGSWMYIVNGKSVTGSNSNHLADSTPEITNVMYPGGNQAAADAATGANQYQFQLERASLVSAPVPTAAELATLTQRVAENNFYSNQNRAEDARVMKFLRDRIEHVIYIIKENRTFDQILGDLNNGSNGDPSLTQFGESITPNHHRLAREFVTLDNFMDPGDGSMDGWSWGLQGRVTNTEALTQQINYSFVDRGLSYESEGTNRNVPVNLETIAQRDAVSGPAGTTEYSKATAMVTGGTENLLTGRANHASSDSPSEEEGGYIFSAAMQAGRSVRNYGFLTNNIGSIGTVDAPISDAFASNEIQVGVLEPSLTSSTDVYFRGYDQNYPDLWRYNEWKREFDQYVAKGELPNLSLVRFSHDHMGGFMSALAGVNTPETQQGDNDLAVGLLVQAIAQSPFAANTLIIVTEDDCQDGPDHVDSHRATAYVVGPYVKKGAVVNTHYSQVSALRTIEDVLGTEHLNLNTAYQRPMTDVFDTSAPAKWTFVAEASTVLQTTQFADAINAGTIGVRVASGTAVKPKHNAAYWANLTKTFDFSQADRVPPAKFNRVLWKGLMGAKPYPFRVESLGAKSRDDDD